MRFFVIIFAFILAVAGIIFGIMLLNREPDPAKDPVNSPEPGITDSAAQASPAPVNPSTPEGQASLAEQLGNEGSDMQGWTEEQQIKVEDLSVTPGLPSQWMNVLLLGTDARNLAESSRTDTIMICSINTDTGAVKLTSIARDTAINYTDIGEYNGIYRINAANFFGGPELVMKTINEKLGMNIEDYVLVNFYGFQYIVEMLGGVDVNITQAEMDEINIWQKKQYSVGVKYGYDESGLEKQDLETYGENTHLNGRQALAYCRIRKLDSDFSRTERQRTVMAKMLEKMKGTSAVELTNLALSMQQYFETNMTIDEILSVAIKVLGATSGMQQFRLPVNDTYVQETRNNQAMLYDCDWEKNSLDLYNFIYG